MTFADEINRIRLKSFLTQEAFAKELGVSFNTVNRWETGKQRPGVKAMKVIDDYCKKNNIDFDIADSITSE